MKTLLIVVGLSFGFLLSAFADDKFSLEDNRLPAEAVRALAIGQQFILYSLDPGDPKKLFKEGPPVPGPEGSLNGFKILGSLRLTDQEGLSTALVAVNSAIRAADYRLMTACFFPRHALRVTANGEAFDFMICYECQQIQLYRRGHSVAVIAIPNAPEPLNDLLSAAKIPLSTPPSPK